MVDHQKNCAATRCGAEPDGCNTFLLSFSDFQSSWSHTAKAIENSRQSFLHKVTSTGGMVELASEQAF